MRQPSIISRLVLIFAVLLVAQRAHADDRSDARAHYQAGVKLYGGGDYRGAIREFSAAQQLLPADLNNYNLALCYDKLGDADNAITYYKQYLDKVPDAPKRAEIEASVSRLEGARKSVADKKADADKKAADDKAAADKKVADDTAAKTGPAVVAPEPTPPPMTGVGSTGTPSSGVAVTTGDAQLDRVQGINIDQIRDQRMGAAGSGMPQQQYGGPQQGPNQQQMQQNGPPNANGMAAMNGPQNPQQGPVQPSDKPAAPSETPVYKKWWFWVVVAVSAYVVYEIATQDSTSSSNTGRDSKMFDTKGSNAYHQPSAGMTLLTF